ncbi:MULTISPECIES: SusC/RagA family TonB-linked outer membrane protein [Bacteroides]|nr:MULTISPECIES: TonB-dependent receptor [Bacteroides]MCS3060818.1 TonB-dependent receptor [Bacteroides salyersiae]UYU42780.1 TonB-dependent receptor [Bacteroides salyersiae]UYU45760.1 TonB-dependent receptor [Bacteroides salyersiae]WMS09503.1 TonB-dependent receptor [Bacteroides salyersiae]
MKTEYQCKSRMKHTLLIGTAMFLISPITLFAGVTAHSDAGSETGISNVTQQQQTVKGIIKGPDGLPVIAANISQKGTNNATITDLNGNFTLNVTGRQPVLVISYIGYVTTEVNVSGRAFVEVVLQEDVAALDEVVVVGYGTMRKKDVTGAVSSVRSGEITKNATSNVMQAIAGKMSGVQVVQNSGTPGGDVSILIRGVGTINDASPLYVIDGVPVSGGMWYLNPNDVESIDVLKDASATAIYGSRGANGVVMVTTKQAQEGHTEINFDYSYGIQHSAKTYKMLDASQYAALHNEMRTNAGPEYSLNPAFADPESLGAGTDWMDAIFRTAPMQKVNLSMLGGNQKISHATSLGYYTQDGIMKNSSYNRLSLQSNISSKLASNITVRANVNLSAENRRTQPVSTVIQNAMRILPSIPIYDDNGEYAGPTGNAEWNGNALNPVAIINEQNYRMKGFRMLSNISLEWEIIKGLKFKTTGGAELGYDYNNSYIPKYKWGMNESKNTMQTVTSAYEQLYLWDNTLNYDKAFGKHRINAMIGTSYQEYKKESVSAAGSGRASELTTELDNATKATDVGGNSYRWALMSYMARLHYSYDDRYLLTATFRADGSSKFGKDNRFGYFPSFAAAWNIGNEAFMQSVKPVSLLKLRAGYGQTGNQNIGAYAFADKLSVNGVYNFGSQRGFESNLVNLIYPYLLSNPSVKWESVEQYNVGLDIGFLQNRIVANLDFYVKNTRDMLTKKPVPQTSGTSLEQADWPPVNIGKVLNRGFEFTVNTKNFVGEFKWETSLNMSFNHNEVVSIGGPEILNGVSLIREGQPINSFYGYELGGIYQTLDEVFTGPVMENRAPDKASHNPYKNTSPGDMWFVDVDGNGEINDLDRTVIGNPSPDCIFGFNNTFSYKNFDLSIFFQGALGNQVWNGVRASHESMNSTYNQLATTLERWTGEGSSYSMPRAIYADPNNNSRASTRWLEDGAYAKLKNLTFGYTLPEKWIRKAKMKALRLYVSLDNLCTITNYSGLDPEAGLSGLDYGVYPSARTYMFGVSVKF